MLPAEAFVIVALATYRIARIATLDSISEPWREMLRRWAWDDDNPTTGPDGLSYAAPRGWLRTWLVDLLTCSLCFGVWAAAATYSLWRWSGSSVARACIVILAAAGVQCFLATRSDA